MPSARYTYLVSGSVLCIRRRSASAASAEAPRTAARPAPFPASDPVPAPVFGSVVPPVVGAFVVVVVTVGFFVVVVVVVPGFMVVVVVVVGFCVVVDVVVVDVVVVDVVVVDVVVVVVGATQSPFTTVDPAGQQMPESSLFGSDETLSRIQTKPVLHSCCGFPVEGWHGPPSSPTPCAAARLAPKRPVNATAAVAARPRSTVRRLVPAASLRVNSSKRWSSTLDSSLTAILAAMLNTGPRAVRMVSRL